MPYWARVRHSLGEEDSEEDAEAHLSRLAPLAVETGTEMATLSKERLAGERAKATLRGRRGRELNKRLKVPLLDDPLRVTNLRGSVIRRRDKTTVYDNLVAALEIIRSIDVREGRLCDFSSNAFIYWDLNESKLLIIFL